eukprot:jgi/Mesvir1/13568/Mv25011-RA.2
MEWELAGRLGSPPNCGSSVRYVAFHPSQALLAAAYGQVVLEFDASLGCVIGELRFEAAVSALAFSPSDENTIVAALQDGSIRSWDVPAAFSNVLYAGGRQDKKASKDSALHSSMHLALSPFHRLIFFGAVSRSSINVITGGKGRSDQRPPKRKIKNHNKAVTVLSCHPSMPFMLAGYSDGTVTVHALGPASAVFTCSFQVSPEHPKGNAPIAMAIAYGWSRGTLFVADSSGGIGMWHLGKQTSGSGGGGSGCAVLPLCRVSAEPDPLVSLGYLQPLECLVALTRTGSVSVWMVMAHQGPRSSQLVKSDELAALDHERFCGDEASAGKGPCRVPKVLELACHSQLNLAAVLLGESSGGVSLSSVRDARQRLLSAMQQPGMAQGGTGRAAHEERSVSGGRGGGSARNAVGASKERFREWIAEAGVTSYLTATSRQARVGADSAAYVTLGGADASAGRTDGSSIVYELFQSTGPTAAHSSSGIRSIPLLSILEKRNPLRSLPIAQPMHLSLGHFVQSDSSFGYPGTLFFVDNMHLAGYELRAGVATARLKLPQPEDIKCRRVAIRLVMGPDASSPRHAAVVFRLEGSLGAVAEGSQGGVAAPARARYEYILIKDVASATAVGAAESGRDVAFFAGPAPSSSSSSSSASLAAEDGMLLALNSNGQGAVLRSMAEARTGEVRNIHFKKPTTRVFAVPAGCQALFVDAACLWIGDLKAVSRAPLRKESYGVPRLAQCHRLESGEVVLQAAFQSVDAHRTVAAVMTSYRILLLAMADLSALACLWAPQAEPLMPPYFSSLLWCGPALLFTTRSHVHCMGWDAHAPAIASLHAPGSVLGAALNDRLLILSPIVRAPPGALHTSVDARAVGLLDPLAHSYLSLADTIKQLPPATPPNQSPMPVPKLELASWLQTLAKGLDATRVSLTTLHRLCDAGFADLAAEMLAAHGSHLSPDQRFPVLLRAAKYSTALSLLDTRWQRAFEYPSVRPGSLLWSQYALLARASVAAAQFATARVALERIRDVRGLAALAVCELGGGDRAMALRTGATGGGEVGGGSFGHDLSAAGLHADGSFAGRIGAKAAAMDGAIGALWRTATGDEASEGDSQREARGGGAGDKHTNGGAGASPRRGGRNQHEDPESLLIEWDWSADGVEGPDLVGPGFASSRLPAWTLGHVGGAVDEMERLCGALLEAGPALEVHASAAPGPFEDASSNRGPAGDWVVPRPRGKDDLSPPVLEWEVTGEVFARMHAQLRPLAGSDALSFNAGASSADIPLLQVDNALQYVGVEARAPVGGAAAGSAAASGSHFSARSLPTHGATTPGGGDPGAASMGGASAGAAASTSRRRFDSFGEDMPEWGAGGGAGGDSMTPSMSAAALDTAEDANMLAQERAAAEFRAGFNMADDSSSSDEDERGGGTGPASGKGSFGGARISVKIRDKEPASNSSVGGGGMVPALPGPVPDLKAAVAGLQLPAPPPSAAARRAGGRPGSGGSGVGGVVGFSLTPPLAPPPSRSFQKKPTGAPPAITKPSLTKTDAGSTSADFADFGDAPPFFASSFDASGTNSGLGASASSDAPSDWSASWNPPTGNPGLATSKNKGSTSLSSSEGTNVSLNRSASGKGAGSGDLELTSPFNFGAAIAPKPAVASMAVPGRSPAPPSLAPGTLPPASSMGPTAWYKTALEQLERQKLPEADGSLANIFQLLLAARHKSRGGADGWDAFGASEVPDGGVAEEDAELMASQELQIKLARACAQYKLAVILLARINALEEEKKGAGGKGSRGGGGGGGEGSTVEAARLSRHMCMLSLKGKHRLMFTWAAITRNMEAHNWAWASEQVQVLLSKCPPDKSSERASLQAQLDSCVRGGNVDASVPAGERLGSEYICAISSVAMPAGAEKIPGSGWTACEVCALRFSPDVSRGQASQALAGGSSACPVCGMGKLCPLESES